MVLTAKHDQGKIILLCGVFLVMTGLGMTLPVLPFYIEKLLSSGGVSSNPVSLHVGLITGSFPFLIWWVSKKYVNDVTYR